MRIFDECLDGGEDFSRDVFLQLDFVGVVERYAQVFPVSGCFGLLLV